MAVYSTDTKMSPEQAIASAISYFGAGGLGLETSAESGCCVNFRGGGGYILVTAASVGEGKTRKTALNFETREWDYDVKKYLRRIR